MKTRAATPLSQDEATKSEKRATVPADYYREQALDVMPMLRHKMPSDYCQAFYDGMTLGVSKRLAEGDGYTVTLPDSTGQPQAWHEGWECGLTCPAHVWEYGLP